MSERGSTAWIIDALEGEAAVTEWMTAIDADTGELRWVVFDEWSGDFYVYDTEAITHEIDAWPDMDKNGGRGVMRRRNGRERFERINAALDADPRVDNWYCYAPGDVGRRWVVSGNRLNTTFSTREVEIFLGLL